MKGIILAGGSGTRLHPITLAVSKQLLPVYDKPMIYYPLSVLMLSGIRDVLIISTPEELPRFEALLGDGKKWGLNLSYKEQANPDGIGQAFIIGEEFIGADSVCLILGDNIFYGEGFTEKLQKSKNLEEGSVVFACHVTNPEQFGVVNFDENFKAIEIIEKPLNPESSHAVTGLYFYDNDVIEIAKNIAPSDRGELEITDINNIYLKNNKMKVELLGRGFSWMDTGTHDSLLEAGQFIKTLEENQGLKVACLEEIAFQQGWIGKDILEVAAISLNKTKYGKYLRNILDTV
jgi:glucose-1-phosphate thymidylyltransferase